MSASITAKPTAPKAPSRRLLSDAALILLSHAASRADGLLLPPPTSLRTRGRALQGTLGKLLSWTYVEEIAVAFEEESWRLDEAGSRLGLRITAAGLDAIAVRDTVSTSPEAAQSETTVGVDDVAASDSSVDAGALVGPDERGDDALALATSPILATEPAPIVNARRSAPQRAKLIALLRVDEGLSISELASALGWLPHTTRAALTGLRKSGYILGKAKRRDGVTVYSLAGESLNLCMSTSDRQGSRSDCSRVADVRL